MSRAGKVFVQNVYAGKISETDEGYEFVYAAEYLATGEAKAISLTLPLCAEPYFSKTLFSFFDGLIPEGWLLNLVEKNWKLLSSDRFGLLLAVCRDCIGDVHILPEDEA